MIVERKDLRASSPVSFPPFFSEEAIEREIEGEGREQGLSFFFVWSIRSGRRRPRILECSRLVGALRPDFLFFFFLFFFLKNILTISCSRRAGAYAPQEAGVHLDSVLVTTPTAPFSFSLFLANNSRRAHGQDLWPVV